MKAIEAMKKYRIPTTTTPEELESSWSKLLTFGDVEATATKRENERLHKENLSLQEEVQALKDLVCDTTLRASNAEAEVVQLKAKLYDCLMSDLKPSVSGKNPSVL